jgi:hypothetical protein
MCPQHLCISSDMTNNPQPGRAQPATKPGNYIMMELRPILLRRDWTPEKDFEAYEYRYGKPDGDYFSAAFEQVAESYRQLNEVVDAALAYFQRKDNRLVPVPPETLPLCEKLLRLSVITDTRKATYEYKARFTEVLHAAIWFDNERRRLLENYYLVGEGTWLLPLGELADFLFCVAMELWEAMTCEHDDYKSDSPRSSLL